MYTLTHTHTHTHTHLHAPVLVPQINGVVCGAHDG